jgi:hypothetical protein
MARGHVQQVPQKAADQERRLYDRVETSVDALLYIHGRTQRIVIHNISRGGMKLKGAFGLMIGDVVTIELVNRRTFGGTVVWAIAPYTGITFDSALAEDDPLLNVTHCRN